MLAQGGAETVARTRPNTGNSHVAECQSQKVPNTITSQQDTRCKAMAYADRVSAAPGESLCGKTDERADGSSQSKIQAFRCIEFYCTTLSLRACYVLRACFIHHPAWMMDVQLLS